MIEYPPLAQVEGLTFRHFAGEEDYQLRLDLWMKNREFNDYDWAITLDDLKNEQNWRKNYDINEQIVFVELNDEPIGYLFYNWNLEEDPKGYMLHVGINLLEAYWDGPIPQIMLEYQEEKLDAMTKDLPKDAPRLYSLGRSQKAEKQLAFYAENGYTPVRYFFEMIRPMSKPIGEHPLPEGLEIRPVKPEEYRTIWDGDNEAFRDHWGYSEPTEEQYQAWLKDRNFRPELWKVAWDGDQVAGMVGNFIDPKENEEYKRKRGYTEDIWVRRPWRGIGLAKALIAESNRMFKEMGMEETALGVDAENPSGALKLYTSMGYDKVEDKTHVVLRKELKDD